MDLEMLTPLPIFLGVTVKLYAHLLISKLHYVQPDVLVTGSRTATKISLNVPYRLVFNSVV